MMSLQDQPLLNKQALEVLQYNQSEKSISTMSNGKRLNFSNNF